jgi:threonine/homoserine/homoserine lactone efflux protein
MILTLVGKAFLLGIVVTAPVGPVGALVIRRTLSSGLFMGIMTGLGAAVCDSMFATLAALGLGPVEEFLRNYEFQLAIFGGILLLIIGAFSLNKTLREHKRHPEFTTEEELTHEIPAQLLERERSFSRDRSSLAKYGRASVGSYFITLSNPVTILGFAGTFAAFGFMSQDASQDASVEHVALIVAGVFAGAMSWWSGLSSFLHWMRGRLPKSAIYMLHLITNGIILASGVLCIVRGFLK